MKDRWIKHFMLSFRIMQAENPQTSSFEDPNDRIEVHSTQELL